MKTMGKFVLIDNSNKKQIFLQWKTKHSMNRTQQNKFPTTLRYSARKTLISDLNPNKQQKYQINAKNTHAQIKTSASTHQLVPFVYMNPERQNMTRHSKKDKYNTFYRTRSLGRITRMSADDSVKRQQKRYEMIDIEKLKTVIAEADKKKGRAICVIKSRRDGLRYNIKYQFVPIYQGISHSDFTTEIKQRMFQQFVSLSDKKVYLFHLSKEPINNIYNNVNAKQFVIFADVSPKFDVPFQMQMKLFQHASIIQQKIKQLTLQLQHFKNANQQEQFEGQKANDQPKQKYQWQKIKDVKKYVQKLIQNPKQARLIKKQNTEKDEIQLWYQQKAYLDELKKGQKNPFFDVQCHFPKETAKIQTLTEVANRVAELPRTVNKHQLKAIPLQNMMQKIKRQNQDAVRLKKMEQDRLRILGYKCEKQVLRDLDRKNIPLLFQNIPFMMEKYGINRAQIYNLYNLYKSLQKISALRLFGNNQHRRVIQKGIDRETFDEGLKGLQINAGDQLVKNICYFPTFITWEEFIKIVSISMRKTPKSKLEAILEGLGSSDRGYLTIEQVDIMVGSSLQKIFGKVQVDLRKYFVSLVMKTFDTDKSGTIQINQIRQHVLTRGIQDLDLVSYLMLNS